MRPHRALGYVESHGDLVRALSPRDVADDLGLARAEQACCPRVWPARRGRIQPAAEVHAEDQLTPIETDPAHRILQRHTLAGSVAHHALAFEHAVALQLAPRGVE